MSRTRKLVHSLIQRRCYSLRHDETQPPPEISVRHQVPASLPRLHYPPCDWPRPYITVAWREATGFAPVSDAASDLHLGCHFAPVCITTSVSQRAAEFPGCMGSTNPRLVCTLLPRTDSAVFLTLSATLCHTTNSDSELLVSRQISLLFFRAFRYSLFTSISHRLQNIFL